MDKILVPIGTSPDSHETLQYAVDFATQFSFDICVMEAFSISTKAGNLGNVKEKVAESGKERLKEVVAKVDAKGISIQIVTYNGDIIDGIKEIDAELGIDFIIIAPRSSDIKEELYLGNVSGKIIKRTDIPTLIIPKGTQYRPFKKILTAFKSGILKRNRILDPLIAIKRRHRAKVNLLLVKTPGYTDEDLQVNTALMDICSHLTITENPTTYHGVLQHFQTLNPDLLCVFRRKRGFFKKLWEKNTILKSEFSVPIPVLVLSVKKD